MTLDLDRVAQALPGYEIGSEVGRGGWGLVVSGRHRQLGRAVAIKELPRAFAADASVQARFIAEARVLASLDHPHIVPVYDYVESDGLCLLVMEYLPGGTVWSRFSGAGLTLDAAAGVVLATCAALECAHNQGVLHRDIKPENVMFSGTGVLKVTDFGLAKVLGGAETLATQAGDVLGTPAYMSPEQAQGHELTPATDVYAAGMMLYELLSGQLPFPEDGDAMSVLYRHVHEQPKPLSQVAPDVPASVADVVMRALSTDPADRWASAEAFGVALAEACTYAWGVGWLGRGSMRVMAADSIVAATERPSGQPAPVRSASGGAAPATAPPGAPVTAPPGEAVSGKPGSAPPTEIPAGPGRAPLTEVGVSEGSSAGPSHSGATAGSAGPQEATSPNGSAGQRVSVLVRPSISVHAGVLVMGDDVCPPLVPVREVLAEQPKKLSRQLAVALGLLAVAFGLAFLGLGGPATGGTIRAGTVSVQGVDVSSGRVVDLNLSKPVVVSGTVPGVNRVELHLSALGIPLGSGSGTATATSASGSSFEIPVDASGARLLAVGLVTGKLVLPDGTYTQFSVKPARSPWLSVPGAVGIAVVLFVAAYAESLVRSLRRGRKRLAGTVGLTALGLLGGLCAVWLAWMTSTSEPVIATVIVCALLGAGSGFTAARAALSSSSRRPRLIGVRLGA